jgi:hypothetical protein
MQHDQLVPLVIEGQQAVRTRQRCNICQSLADGDFVKNFAAGDIDNRYCSAALVGDGEDFAAFDPPGGDGATEERAVFERGLGGGGERWE